MKKLAFLDQNYGLTPLETFDFWDVKNFFFTVRKSFFSIWNIIKPSF